MLIVVGLGGNALTRRGEDVDAATLAARLDVAARAIIGLSAHGSVVVTHGNGPQVGSAALGRPTAGLDVLDASTEGEIGYLLELALRNHAPDGAFATLLTPVLVEADDPAFAAPTKPIGRVYDLATAQGLARDRGWTVAPDGDGWRRMVASPQPRRVLVLPAISALVQAGVTVICAGGGGIPVVAAADGRLRGADAVIDKDATTAALAVALEADAVLLLTDVDGVQTGFGTSRARTLHKVSASALSAGALSPGPLSPGPPDAAAPLAGLTLPPGSMGAKVAAACRFARETGRVAGIGRLEDAAALLVGQAGTLVTAGDVETRWWGPPMPGNGTG